MRARILGVNWSYPAAILVVRVMQTPTRPMVRALPQLDPRIARLRTMADAMQRAIDHARRPMTQNPTPKRLREYHSRLWEADNLERTQKALRSIAEALEAGTLPAILDDVRTKKDAAPLVYKGLLGGGYYDVIRDPEYRDQGEKARALQALIEGQRTAGDAEREKAEHIREMEDALRFVDLPGFFPTPRPLAERVRDLLNLNQPFLKVLEPSAGKGDIAEVLCKDREGRPTQALVHCIEIRSSLQAILKAKGLEVIGEDFLECFTGSQDQQEGVYDRIAMNPPFENGQDIEHVRHAHTCLKSGGRLVAIMSEGPFFRQDARATAFREWLAERQAEGRAWTEKLPEGSFTGPGSFRQTGVAARIVVVDKP